MATEKDIALFKEKTAAIFKELAKDVVGQKEAIEGIVIAMIGGGNVLLQGVPGTGKTRLVRSVGKVFGLDFSRIQFTPDLMPADVTGTNIIEKDEKGNNCYRFRPGPIFSQIVLADEINRATPKTQSALLEAMQEHIVSVDGTDYKLKDPFFVLATQNPIEQDGTYSLPEAQTDRFMFELEMTFPAASELKNIVLMTQKTMEETAEQILDAETLLNMRQTAKEILISDDILTYAVELVTATHPEIEGCETAKKWLRLGASPRACQALITTAKVRAMMHGRYNVDYEDVNALAYPVLRHRIKPNFDAVAAGKNTDDIIGDLISSLSRKKHPILGGAK